MIRWVESTVRRARYCCEYPTGLKSKQPSSVKVKRGNKNFKIIEKGAQDKLLFPWW